MAKFKTYSRRCHSHKKGVWGGVSQGVGLLHRGDTVEMSLNVSVENEVFEPRVGSEDYRSFEGGGIISAQRTTTQVSVASGTSIYVCKEMRPERYESAGLEELTLSTRMLGSMVLYQESMMLLDTTLFGVMAPTRYENLEIETEMTGVFTT